MTFDIREYKKSKSFVRGIVADVVKGDIADAICGVVGKGIDALMASTFGSVSEKTLYTVKVDGISMQRIDVYMLQVPIQYQGGWTHLNQFEFVCLRIQHQYHQKCNSKTAPVFDFSIPT